MKFRASLLTLCLIALPALAGSSVDELRSSARGVRDQVSQLKGQQLSLRSELSTLSSRIETLKVASKGKLLPGSELDGALKKSQELSTVLTSLAQQVSLKEAELEAAQLSLLGVLSQELTRLRADFDATSDRPQRAQLIDQMKRLRVEREAVRVTLPQAKVPALEALKPSDDPEVLLEQADLLRDNHEKLEKELKALDTRIAERRQEVDLDRRVQRFMGEESLFDDQDRRLRVQRTSTELSATSSGGPQQSRGTSGGADTAGSPAGSPLSPAAPKAADSAAPGAGGLGNFENPGSHVASGSDARPQVGTARAVLGDDADLSALEAERAKLKNLSTELKNKAQALEQRAAQLK